MKKIFISTLIISLFFASACGKIKLTQENPKDQEGNNEMLQDLDNMQVDDMSDIDDMNKDVEDIFKDIESTDISGEGSSTNTSTDSNISIPKPLEDTQNSQSVKVISIDAFEFGYSSSSLKFKAEEKVKLTLKNTGKMKHDWILEGTSIKTKIIDGGTSTVYEFTAPAKGNYKAYCSVGSHRAAGMEMNVVVE